jgi:hypothetical protein
MGFGIKVSKKHIGIPRGVIYRCFCGYFYSIIEEKLAPKRIKYNPPIPFKEDQFDQQGRDTGNRRSRPLLHSQHHEELAHKGQDREELHVSNRVTHGHD